MYFNDSVEFSYENNTLIIDGNIIQLDRRQSELLYFLYTNENKIFSRQEILENVWKTILSDQVVTQSIYHLRRIFKENNISPPIITVPKKGYVFKSNVLKKIEEKEEVKGEDEKHNKSLLNKGKSNFLVYLFSAFTFLLISFIVINEHQKKRLKSTIDSTDIVHLSSNAINIKEKGLIKIIKGYFSINYNLNFLDEHNDFFENHKEIDITFIDEDEYHNKNEKDIYTLVTHNGSISRDRFLTLMKDLEEVLLFKIDHNSLNSFYSSFPKNQQAFDYILSFIGESERDIFNLDNIDKLNKAYALEPKNEYLISMKYIFNLLNTYSLNYNQGIKIEIIKGLNASFMNDIGHITDDDLNNRSIEALSAYYLSINDKEKAKYYIEKIKYNQMTVISLLLRAKVAELFDDKDKSKKFYFEISNKVKSKNIEKMEHAFFYSEINDI